MGTYDEIKEKGIEIQGFRKMFSIAVQLGDEQRIKEYEGKMWDALRKLMSSYSDYLAACVVYSAATQTLFQYYEQEKGRYFTVSMAKIMHEQLYPTLESMNDDEYAQNILLSSAMQLTVSYIKFVKEFIEDEDDEVVYNILIEGIYAIIKYTLSIIDNLKLINPESPMLLNSIKLINMNIEEMADAGLKESDEIKKMVPSECMKYTIGIIEALYPK